VGTMPLVQAFLYLSRERDGIARWFGSTHTFTGLRKSFEKSFALRRPFGAPYHFDTGLWKIALTRLSQLLRASFQFRDLLVESLLIVRTGFQFAGVTQRQLNAV